MPVAFPLFRVSRADHAFFLRAGLQQTAAIGTVESGFGDQAPGRFVGIMEEDRVFHELVRQIGSRVFRITVLITEFATLKPERVGLGEMICRRFPLKLDRSARSTVELITERERIRAEANRHADLASVLICENERLFVHPVGAFGTFSADSPVLFGNKLCFLRDTAFQSHGGDVVVRFIGLQAELNIHDLRSASLHLEHVAVGKIYAECIRCKV